MDFFPQWVTSYVYIRHVTHPRLKLKNLKMMAKITEFCVSTEESHACYIDVVKLGFVRIHGTKDKA